MNFYFLKKCLIFITLSLSVVACGSGGKSSNGLPKFDPVHPDAAGYVEAHVTTEYEDNRYFFSYDAEGKLISVARNFEDDKKASLRFLFAYNSLDLLESYTSEGVTSVGSLQFEELSLCEIAYDDEMRFKESEYKYIGRKFDSKNSEPLSLSSPDKKFKKEYEYNSGGRLAIYRSNSFLKGYEQENVFHGFVYTYDILGNREIEEEYYSEIETALEPDSTITNVFDGHNNKTSVQHEPGVTATYNYSYTGALVDSLATSISGSVTTKEYQFAYDGFDRLVGVSLNFDSHQNAVIDEWLRITYDGSGRVLTKEHSKDDFNSLVKKWSINYTNSGRVNSEALVDNEAVANSYSITYTYQGNLPESTPSFTNTLNVDDSLFACGTIPIYQDLIEVRSLRWFNQVLIPSVLQEYFGLSD